MVPKIAVIGNGYWGKNLVRNFHELGALSYVCDARTESLQEAHATYGVPTVSSVDDLLTDSTLQGVVIAAPAAQHYQIAKQFLRAGKDVYVEKPLALRADQGRELVRIAEEHKRVLMVGHILQYHPAILKLKELIDAGMLGRLEYVHSTRLNWGKFRCEENILWSFAPHDISAILFLLNEEPSGVTASGGAYINPHICDMTLTSCDFQSGVKAHIFVSWRYPFKEQRMVVVGDQRIAVFDDVEPERKLVIYNHTVDWKGRLPVARKGDGQVVELSSDEPLRKECQHFLSCIETRQRPRTDGHEGLRVLEVLEACERALQRRTLPVPPESEKPAYFADATAVIDSGASIGARTNIWHFSHVMRDAVVGCGCNLGQNVVIGAGARVGDRVKIQNNVSVYAGVELEDDVFCGPSMVFTNVINPRSHVDRKHEFRKTLVRRGATIGANATIVCGVTLGRFCFIGAGAVITKDVPDYALMIGVPAAQAGWVCACGVRLPDTPEPHCSSCHRHYRIAGRVCTEVSDAVPMRPMRVEPPPVTKPRTLLSA